jgi:polysaccharide export outer membrane protein
VKYLHIIFLVILFTGCGVKEYQLFTNEDKSLIDNSQEINITYDSKIMPDDVLSIDIYNMNQKSNILTDSDSKEKSQYIVSSDGTIYLPLLQEIEVVGYTAKELSKKITDEYRRYLKQPYAKVTIKNHKVFVLGEVEKQGVVPLEGNSISIIEAISKAGGLTDHASRDKIRVISKYGKKYKIRTLDLSRLSTLNIDNLILKNNSIVYVEPRSSKAIKVGVQDYLPIIQAISGTASTILAIDYISNGRR